MHKHWEVAVLHLDVGVSLVLLLSCSWVADFHDVEFGGSFSGFLLTEAEQRILVGSHICHWHIGESCGITTIKDLLLSFLNEEELHVSADLLVLPGVDSDEVAPGLCCVDTIIHDLTIGKFCFLVKNLCGSSLVVDIGVVDTSFTNNTKSVLVNPLPEANCLLDLALLNLVLSSKVEYLNGRVISGRSAQGNDIL